MSIDQASWGNNDDMFHYDNIMSSKKAKTSAPAAAKKPAKRESAWEQCGLLTRQTEFENLGPPDQHVECFGCAYLGENDTGLISFDEIKSLIIMIRKSISKTRITDLVKHVETKYDQIRTEINSSLMEGEVALPEWKAALILDHLRNHNVDAEMQHWHRMVELQELAQIALSASVIRNDETGEVKIDPIQSKMYIEFVKQMETLSKSDPATKTYYSGGNLLDTKSVNEGFISYSGKPLLAHWKK